MPLCFGSAQFDLEPEVTARRSQIIIERRRTSIPNRKITLPVVYPSPPVVYPPQNTQYALQPQYTHTETQVIVAAPQEQKSEPTPTILNINIEQAASEIAENLATENMLRNQVALLENSLDEERRVRDKEESARCQKEIEEIYEKREERRRSRSRDEQRLSRFAEEAARRRISHEYHRSSSMSRLASSRSSGDRLLLMPEHSNPRHSADRLMVTHTRHHSHEVRLRRCSFCDHPGHGSSECPDGEQDPVRVPVARVRSYASLASKLALDATIPSKAVGTWGYRDVIRGPKRSKIVRA
ncbi:hypothetical protein C7212DRAFT_364736 [Tuber magnatum]|uniref:Uncharacterized protein n=1 Tax=Tuber magnatum TaxID=42249 RepID=A0A317SMS8_9PEZI|nr:hypothetical protein C7212DRAFT_364736 [Tuber magnatum]